MATFGDQPSYMDQFEQYYRDLVRGLPADQMWEDFVANGLVRDVTLAQKMEADRTNVGKIRLLLNDIKRGVSIRQNDSFLKLLDAMEDYGSFAKDQTVLDLAEKIRQELPDGEDELHFLPGSLQLSSDPDDDGNEKIIMPDKGVGSMPPQALMAVVNAVVTIKNEGTGFIGRVKLDDQFCIVLVTNNHVFDSASKAEASSIKFEGKNDFVYLYELMIKDSYITNKELDYAMVRLDQDKLNNQANIEPIELSNPARIKHGDQIYIVQHPDLRPTEFSSSSCTLLDAFMMYQSGTQPGSSGSPVLKEVNRSLVIVALHRGGICKKDRVGYNYGSQFSEILKSINDEDYLKTPSKMKIQKHLKKYWKQ